MFNALYFVCFYFVYCFTHTVIYINILKYLKYIFYTFTFRFQKYCSCYKYIPNGAGTFMVNKVALISYIEFKNAELYMMFHLKN